MKRYMDYCLLSASWSTSAYGDVLNVSTASACDLNDPGSASLGIHYVVCGTAGGGRTARFTAMGLALSVLFVFMGCSSIGRRVPIEVDAGYVLDRIKDNVDGLQDFEGQAEVYVWRQGMNQQVFMRVLFKRPDLLRVEVYGPLGVSLFKMSLRGEWLTLYAPMADRFVVEPVEGGLLQGIMGFDLRPEELRDALLGTMHVGPGDLEHVARFERREGAYWMVVKKAGRIHELAVDDRRWTVLEDDVFNAHGELIVRRTMRRFVNVHGVALPRSVELVRNGDRIQIEFTSQRANLGLSEYRFEIRDPRSGGGG